MTRTDKATILKYKDFVSLYNFKLTENEKITQNLQVIVADYTSDIDDESFSIVNESLCSKVFRAINAKIGDHYYEIQIQGKYNNLLNNREITTDDHLEFSLPISENPAYLERISIRKKSNTVNLKNFVNQMIESPELLILKFGGDINDLREQLLIMLGKGSFESLSLLLYNKKLVDSFVIQCEGSWVYRFKAFFINSYGKTLGL